MNYSESESSEASDWDGEVGVACIGGSSSAKSDEEDECEAPFIKLCKACREGNVEELKQLIQEDKSVAVCDSRGWFPQHEAAVFNRPECLKLVLQQSECDIDQTTYDGRTALFLAAESGQLSCVKLLLSENADPDVTDDNLDTPLHIAITSEENECAIALLESPNSRTAMDRQNVSLNSPITSAVNANLTDVVKLLISKGCNFTKPGDFGITPIFVAAQFGRIECLKLLVTAAKDMGLKSAWDEAADDGGTPLYIAAQEGHTECVRTLLACGADPTKALIEDHYVPLSAAVFKGNHECVRLLWNSRESSVWECLHPNILDLAVCSDHSYEMVELLLALGCNADLRCDVPKLDLDLAPHTYYTYLVPTFGEALRLDYEKVSFVCPALVSGKEQTALLILGHMSAVEPLSDECPILFFAIMHSPKTPQFFYELITKFRVRMDYYFPRWLVGNMAVILALSRPLALLELLKCGAEVDSVFELNSASESKTSITRLFKSQAFTGRASLDNSYLLDESPWSKATVIRMLLEFTGNVKLDSSLKSCMSDDQWTKLTSITDNPHTLEYSCRRKIRQCLGSQRLRTDEFVRKLELPPNIASYVLYEDLCYKEFVQLMESS